MNKIPNKNKTIEDTVGLTERESGLMKRSMLVGGSLGALIGILVGAFGLDYIMHSQGRTEIQVAKRAAEAAALVVYEPVGNGGALAEMNGYVSPRRQEMYNKMERIRDAVYKAALQH